MAAFWLKNNKALSLVPAEDREQLQDKYGFFGV